MMIVEYEYSCGRCELADPLQSIKYECVKKDGGFYEL